MLKKLLTKIKNNYKASIFAFLSVLTALSLTFGIITHKKNLQLAESLNKAQQNIEVYQGLINPQQTFGVLQLKPEDLNNYIDPVIEKVSKTIKDNKIKPKEIDMVATGTQNLIVKSKEPIKIYIDTLYQDSIIYNKYTKLYYTLHKDTLNTILNIKNNQDLIVYSKKVYKNKKSFIKRLLTLDFKKIRKTEYKLINSNDLIKTDSVRVIEIN